MGDAAKVGPKYFKMQKAMKRKFGSLDFRAFIAWVLEDLGGGQGEDAKVVDPHWRPFYSRQAINVHLICLPEISFLASLVSSLEKVKGGIFCQKKNALPNEELKFCDTLSCPNI